jgi:DNA/RNA endonuclease YhcR with UshA esterase domain
MKSIKVILAIALGVAIVLLMAASLGKKRTPLYDVATEVSARGVVQQVQDFYCPVSGDEGTHLVLLTETGTIQVHVAPGRFLRGNRLSFAKGDQVEVVGAKFNYKGADTLIARKISWRNESIALRQPGGKPMWME